MPLKRARGLYSPTYLDFIIPFLRPCLFYANEVRFFNCQPAIGAQAQPQRDTLALVHF